MKLLLACLVTVNTAGADMHTHSSHCHGYHLETSSYLEHSCEIKYGCALGMRLYSMYISCVSPFAEWLTVPGSFTAPGKGEL